MAEPTTGWVATAGIPRGKVTAPQVPVDLLARPALAARVDATEPRVGLVVAPAGFGKTLLLADHARRHPDTAWVTVDRNDDAPRLWSAILAALSASPALPSGSGLRRLEPPPGRARPAFLSRLRDELGEVAGPLTLVLDDVHELDDPTALEALRALLDHRPATLRVLLASRFDPPVAPYRPRDRDGLWELRADRLSFSPTETRQLLRRTGLALSDDQSDELHRRTGGWAAGLRLAIQAMRGGADPSAFLTAFSGVDHSVADYLVGEVLETLDPDVLEFLTVASIGDPLPAELAAELTGRDDAAEFLARVERETSLVTGFVTDPPGEPHLYRVLELLRTHLAADLHRRRPALATELHGRAARWWADRDRPTAALEHAARADDEDLTADLMDRFGLRLALEGEHAPLRALPGAAVAVTRGDFRTVVRRADEAVSTAAERRWEPSAWSTLGRTLRAYAALYRAEPGRALAEASEAMACGAGRNDPRLHHALRIVRGAARSDEGDRAAGVAEMRQARIDLAGVPVVAEQAAAAALFENRTALRLGDSVGAARAARELADRVDAPGEVALMAAWAELGSGRLEAAGHRLRPVLQGRAAAVMPHTLVEAHLVAATLAVHAGDRSAARHALRAALTDAEALELLRPFALGGPEVGALLAEHSPGTGTSAEFAALARDAHRRIADPAASPVLSEREIAVLGLLPSLMSTDEIAAALSVSVSTVKTHVRMIYTKLAVGNRRAAVERARDRGLLREYADAARPGRPA